MKECSHSRFHVRLPDGAECLPLGVRGFLFLIVKLARFARWTDASNEQLAEQTKLSVATVARYLAILKRTKVPGHGHAFLGTTDSGDFPRVNGRRRLYPVDERGSATIPADLTAARLSGDALAHHQRGARGVASTKGDSRASLSFRDPDNDSGRQRTQRQRPEAQSSVNAQIECPTITQGQLPAPSRSAVELQAPAPPAAAIATVKPAAVVEQCQTSAPPSEQEVLTDGQREFVNRLMPEQRAKLEAMAPIERAKFLEPFRASCCPIIGAEWAAKLGSRKAAAPPPPPPQSTVEFIARLPGGCASWVQSLAERFAHEFKDRKFWRCYLQVAQAVWLGTLPVEPVLHAYRHARRPGRAKPGAYFWSTLQDRAGLDQAELGRRASPGRTAAGAEDAGGRGPRPRRC